MLNKRKLPLNIAAHFTKEECIVLRSLLDIFEAAEKEIYLVGGCVRDLLLNRPMHDIDLTTNATPDEMIKMASGSAFHIIETGIKHGTVTFYNPEYEISFEVTTYRTDADYTDHRHPDQVVFSASLEEDLKRRDFTINSFAYDINNQELLMLDENYFSDIEVGVIKCVGNPEERFNEDALRMLRALRFSAQLGFTLDYDTYKAIQKLAPTLVHISMERIRDELTKMLISDHPEVLDLLRVTKLADYLGEIKLPLQELLESRQYNKYHYTDVFHHTLDVLRMTPKDAEIRWAALFHDFGKLKCETVGEDGYMHYYGHPDISCEDSLYYMEHLRFPNETRDNVYKLVKYHDSELKEIKNSHFKKLVNEIGIDLFPKFLRLRYADAMAHKLAYDTDFYISSVGKAKERFAKILKDKDAMTLKDLKINGYDLLNLGYSGPEIGKQLNKLLELVLEDPKLNDHETLYNLSIK